MLDISRRKFLSRTVSGSGLLILPSGTITGANSPSNKLNIALIGVGGRGKALRKFVTHENIVAICDVDELALADAAKQFPKAARYFDWRKCLEDKNVEAVVAATNDQSHALIGLWAMNRGMHVYLEKPIAVSVEECRLLRERYNENKGKLATQLGTQRNGWVNFRRVKDLIRDGAIGTVQSASAWTTRYSECKGYLPGAGSPPSTLHYDLWLGPASYHPYNPDYFGSCSKWQKYWDFGTGHLGNWGSHVADLGWLCVEGNLPTHAEGEGDPYHSEAVPSKLRLTFELPGNSWRPPIAFRWDQGGYTPTNPTVNGIDLKTIQHGVLFKGDQGILITDFWNRILIPDGKQGDLSYFHPRDSKEATQPVPEWGQNWLDACKGGPEPDCNFNYSAPIMETLLVGLAAWRAKTQLDYDAKTGTITNAGPANDFLKRHYREGWPLDA